jgi:hypothetical protein
VQLLAAQVAYFLGNLPVTLLNIRADETPRSLRRQRKTFTRRSDLIVWNADSPDLAAALAAMRDPDCCCARAPSPGGSSTLVTYALANDESGAGRAIHIVRSPLLRAPQMTRAPAFFCDSSSRFEPSGTVLPEQSFTVGGSPFSIRRSPASNGW